MSNQYFMDDPREARRLAEKVDPVAWAKRFWLPCLGENAHVLDVGCGPAVILAAAAQLRPDVQAVGVDRSEKRVQAANVMISSLANASVRQADAVSLPFSGNEFDFVSCRFLLEYLEERERAVREMVRVCKPGGTVLLQDLDGQLVWHYPVDQGLEGDLAQVLSVLAKTGFDPFVGRKLFSLSRNAGLQNIQVQVEPYHLIVGRAPVAELDLWELKLDIAQAAIAQALGSQEAAKDLKSRFLGFLSREDTLTYSVLFSVCGEKAAAT